MSHVEPEPVGTPGPQQSDLILALSEMFRKFEESLQSWDKNRNGIIEGTEAVQGLLSTPRLLAMMMSAIGGLYSIIVAVIGYTEEEINWIAFFFGVVIVVTSIIVYLVMRNNSKGTIKTVSRLTTEQKTFIDNLIKENKIHYDGLKERFVDYKDEAEKQFVKFQNKVDGLQERYYQIESSNNFRGSVIAYIQEKYPDIKGIGIVLE